MTKLTKKLVDDLKPKADRYFIWDGQVAGFGCRVTPGGVKSFVVDYNHAGRRRRMSLGRYGALTVDQARKLALEKLGHSALGTDPMTARDQQRADITVNELCDRYLIDGVAHKRETTIKTDVSNIDSHIRPLIGNKRVRDLDEADIRRFYNDTSQGKSKKTEKAKPRGVRRIRGGLGTANRALAVLSAILSYAISNGFRDDNPARNVKPAKLEAREQFLTSEEIKRLSDLLTNLEKSGEANPYAIAQIRLLLLTGARRGEIANASWSNLNPETQMLLVPRGKTGRRYIHLSAAAMEILNSLPQHSDWIFPARSGNGPYQGLPREWRRIREMAGFPTLRIHDLRHTYASLAVQGGTSLYLVQALLGHSSPKMTQRYAHLADDPVASANDQIGQKLADLMAQK